LPQSGSYGNVEPRCGGAKVRVECEFFSTIGDNSRYSCSRALLSKPSIQKDPTLYLEAVQRVIASMTMGVDVSNLFVDMIKVS